MVFKTRARCLVSRFMLISILSACEDITPISQPTFTPLPQPILTALPQPSVAASTENATEEPLPSHPAQPTEIPAPEVSSIPEVTQLLPEAPISALAELTRLASDDASLSNLALTLLTPHPRPIRERAQRKRIESRLNNPTITPTADEYRVASITPPLPIPGGSCKSRIKIGALSLAAVAGLSACCIHNEWLNNGIGRLGDATITHWSRLGDYIPQCADVTAINIRDSYCALVNQGAKYWGTNSFCEGADGIITGILNTYDVTNPSNEATVTTADASDSAVQTTQIEANLAFHVNIISPTRAIPIEKTLARRARTKAKSMIAAFSYPGETPVSIKDNSMKGFHLASIDSIREGDFVDSCDVESYRGTCEFKQVRKIITRTAKHLVTLRSEGRVLKVTPNHRFRVNDEKDWVPAEKLKETDWFLDLTGTAIWHAKGDFDVFFLDKIEHEKGEFKVFYLDIIEGQIAPVHWLGL